MKLKDLGEYFIGLTYKPEDVSDKGTIVLRSGNIQDGQFDLSDIVRVDTVIREKQYVKPGDILMCSRNGSARLVGKSTIIPAINEPMTFGAFMTVFRTPYNDYLKYFLQSRCFRAQLAGSKTTTINQITIRMLDGIDIDLPDNSEREERIKKLEILQRTIRLRKQELQKFDELIKARFVEMFGNPVSNEKGWDQVNMKAVCTKITDGEHGSVHRETTGHPFLNAKHIKQDGSIDWDSITFISDEVHQKIYKRCNPEPGDILMTTTGTIGNVAITPETEAFSMDRGITLLKIDRSLVNSAFITWLLRFEAMQSIMKANIHASAIGHLFLNKVEQLPVIVPPLMQQNDFAAFCDQVDKSKVVIQQALDKAQLLFDSLMQEYFG